MVLSHGIKVLKAFKAISQKKLECWDEVSQCVESVNKGLSSYGLRIILS